MIPKVDFSNFKIKENDEKPEVIIVTDYEGNKIEKETLSGEYELKEFLDKFFAERKDQDV